MRAAATELVGQFRFDFVLHHAGPRGLHRATMGIGGDRRRAAHHLDLVGVLEQPHAVEQSTHILNFRRRGNAAAHLGFDLIEPADNARVPHGIGAERKMQHRLIGDEFGHHLIELGDGVGSIERKSFLRGLRAMAITVPNLAGHILLAAKQYCLRTLSGDDDDNRFRLDKSAEIIKIAIEAIQIMRVAIARMLVRRRDDGDTSAHGFSKLRTTALITRNGDHNSLSG